MLLTPHFEFLYSSISLLLCRIGPNNRTTTTQPKGKKKGYWTMSQNVLKPHVYKSRSNKLTFLMSTGNVRQIIVVHQIVSSHVRQLGIRISQQHFTSGKSLLDLRYLRKPLKHSPLIHGNQREIQLVLALEHHLFLGYL